MGKKATATDWQEASQTLKKLVVVADEVDRVIREVWTKEEQVDNSKKLKLQMEALPDASTRDTFLCLAGEIGAILQLKHYETVTVLVTKVGQLKDYFELLLGEDKLTDKEWWETVGWYYND